MERKDALQWELNELQRIIGRYDNITMIIKGWCFTLWTATLAFFYDPNTAFKFDWFVLLILIIVILCFYSLEVHYRLILGNCIDRSDTLQKSLLINNKIDSITPQSIRETIREKGRHRFIYFIKKLFLSLWNFRVVNIYAYLGIITLLLIYVVDQKIGGGITIVLFIIYLITGVWSNKINQK